jgi:hypothetical protein
MKDIRNTKLELRVTQAEKQKIKDYAAAHDMTVAEVIRVCCEKIFNQKESN